MTINFGHVAADTTLYIPFASYGSDGQSITLTGLIAGDIEIYKDGSVTQRASDAGYALLDTDGIDFDGITGIHGFSVDLSDNTDSGFYAVGSQYWVVVSAVTIDSQTVNFIAATFRIVPAEASSGVPDVNIASIDANAITATAIASNAITAAKIAADAITAAKVAADVHAEAADAVWDELQSGHTGAGTFGEIATEIASILVDTGTTLDGKIDTIDGVVDAILLDTAEIGTAGAGLTEAGGDGDHLTAVVWNAAWDAEVQSEVEDALTAARAEPAGVPAANESLVNKVDYLFMALRNQVTVTATKMTFFDDGGGAEWEKDLSDDGSVYTETEASAI